MLHLFSSDKIFIKETTTFEFGLRNYEENMDINMDFCLKLITETNPLQWISFYFTFFTSPWFLLKLSLTLIYYIMIWKQKRLISSYSLYVYAMIIEPFSLFLKTKSNMTRTASPKRIWTNRNWHGLCSWSVSISLPCGIDIF